MAKHLSTGSSGESLAALYVTKLGWKIVGQNVRIGHKEIDLIAKDGAVTVFIEVKTRHGDAFGSPEEAITEKKLARLHAAIVLYVRRYPAIKHVRLDVISLTYAADSDQKPKLRHLRAVDGGNPLAFLP